MSTCVIVLKEKQPVQELILKLREAKTPILNCNLVEPLDKQTESEELSEGNSLAEFPKQLKFNNVKLLNPTLARKDRQKALATWLIPFGFVTGLSFSQMTDLKTFADMGFPNQFEKLLGGLVGMIAGWLGSSFSAGGINQEIDDDLRALRCTSLNLELI